MSWVTRKNRKISCFSWIWSFCPFECLSFLSLSDIMQPSLPEHSLLESCAVVYNFFSLCRCVGILSIFNFTYTCTVVHVFPFLRVSLRLSVRNSKVRFGNITTYKKLKTEMKLRKKVMHLWLHLLRSREKYSANAYMLRKLSFTYRF